MAVDIQIVLQNFIEISINKSQQIKETENGITNESQLMLQIINYYYINDDEEIPVNISARLEFLEEEFLSNAENIIAIRKINDETKEDLEIDRAISRFNGKYIIQQEISKLQSGPQRYNEIVYEISHDNNTYKLTRKSLASLNFLAHIYDYPQDSLVYYKDNQSLKNLLRKDILESILEALKDEEICKIEKIEETDIEILQLEGVLSEVVEIKESIEYLENFEKDDQEYDSEYDKWSECLRKIEKIQQSNYSKYLLSENDKRTINKTKERLKNNLALKKELRYEAHSELEKLDIFKITLELFEDDKQYNATLIKELDQIISSDLNPNEKTKYGFTRRELTALRLLRALDSDIDKEHGLADSLTNKQKQFLIEFIDSIKDNPQLIDKLQEITNNPTNREQILANEMYDIEKSINNLGNIVNKRKIYLKLIEIDQNENNEEHDNEYDRWREHLLKLDEIHQFNLDYSNEYILSKNERHAIDEIKEKLNKNLALKKELRYEPHDTLEELNILSITIDLLEDDDEYNKSLIKELDKIISSDLDPNENAKYGLTRRELLTIRLLRALALEVDKSHELSELLTDNQRQFLMEFIGDLKTNNELSSKLTNIATDIDSNEEVLANEVYDIKKSIDNLLETPDIRNLYKELIELEKSDNYNNWLKHLVLLEKIQQSEHGKYLLSENEQDAINNIKEKFQNNNQLKKEFRFRSYDDLDELGVRNIVKELLEDDKEYNSSLIEELDQIISSKLSPYQIKKYALNRKELVCFRLLRALDPAIDKEHELADSLTNDQKQYLIDFVESAMSKKTSIESIREYIDNSEETENVLKDELYKFREPLEHPEPIVNIRSLFKELKNLDPNGNTNKTNEYNKWCSYLTKIEEIQQSGYSEYLISESEQQFIDTIKEKLNNNLALKKEIRYESSDRLEELGVLNIARELLEDSKDYNSKLLEELNQVIASASYANEKTKYGLTKSELVSLRMLRALAPDIDQEGELAEKLTGRQKAFLTVFVDQTKFNTELSDKLNKIVKNSEIIQQMQKDEVYDLKKCINELDQLADIRSSIIELENLQQDAEEYDNEYDRWNEHLTLIEKIQASDHVDYMLSESEQRFIAGVKVDLNKNLQLKRELRNESDDYLSELEVKYIAIELLEDDKEYFRSLKQELQKVMASNTYGQQDDAYGFTKKELLFIRLIGALNDKSGDEFVSLLDEEHKKFLAEYLEDVIENKILDSKLQNIADNSEQMNSMLRNERYDVTKMTINLQDIIKIKESLKFVNTFQESSEQFNTEFDKWKDYLVNLQRIRSSPHINYLKDYNEKFINQAEDNLKNNFKLIKELRSKSSDELEEYEIGDITEELCEINEQYNKFLVQQLKKIVSLPSSGQEKTEYGKLKRQELLYLRLMKALQLDEDNVDDLENALDDNDKRFLNDLTKKFLEQPSFLSRLKETYSNSELMNKMSIKERYNIQETMLDLIEFRENAGNTTVPNIESDDDSIMLQDLRFIQNEVKEIRNELDVLKNYDEDEYVDYDQEANIEYTKWYPALKRLEKIMGSQYKKYALNENDQIFINDFKKELNKNLRLKKELRYESGQFLKDNDIHNITTELLAEDRSYEESIISELDQVIDSKKYGNQKSKYGLTKKELLSLQLMRALSADVDKQGSLADLINTNEKYKEYLNNFLIDSMGDMKLNKKLRAITKDGNLKDTIFEEEQYNILKSATFLMKFTFKTRRAKNYNKIADKLLLNLKKAGYQKQNLPIGAVLKKYPKKNKITLKEYGILSDIDGLSLPIPEKLYKDNIELKKIFGKAKQIKPVLSYMKANFQSKKFTGHGLIAMINDKKRNVVQGKTMSFFDKVRYCVSSKFHASLLYRKTPKGKLTETHLCDDGFEQNDYDFKTYMYSDLYRIDLTKLIGKKDRPKLIKAYGPNWEKKISEMYLAIQREIHDGALDNEKFNRVVLADVVKRGVNSIFSSTKLRKTNFEQIRENMLGNFYNTESGESGEVEMICSEFAARCIIAGLAELDRKLKTDLHDNHKKIDINQNKELIKMPIGRHEDIQHITPERLINILKRKKCLSKIFISEEISSVIKNR